ncbi:MAG: hypothetical protein ACYCPR_05480 [Thermoplasmataceae archaeon]
MGNDKIGSIIEGVCNASEVELIEAFKKDSVVYGSLLELLTIKPGDLPQKFSDSILRLADFKGIITDISSSMFDSFIFLALMKKGFFNESLLDDFDEEELIRMNEEFYLEQAATTSHSPEITTFVSRNEPSTLFRICLFKTDPYPLGDEYIYMSLADPNVDFLIQKLDDMNGKNEGKNCHSYLIFDPTIVRLFRKRVEEICEKIRNRLPGWETPTAEEFVSNFLSDEFSDYKDYFKGCRDEAIGILESWYPFIPTVRELSFIKKSRDDILQAVHKSEDFSLSDQDIEDIVRRLTVGIEGLLQALANIIFGAKKDQKSEFNDLISSLRGVIIEDYGEDVWNDLQYLHKLRNSVSHPRDYKVNKNDMIKAAARSRMFLTLFDNSKTPKRRLR